MVELVEEMRKLPSTPELEFMIKEALAGEYHDYKNKKYSCGKMASSIMLRQLGHIDLAKRIEQGEFDEEADAEDVAMMRRELGDDKQGMAIRKALGLD